MVNHVYFSVYNIYLRVYVPWAYNINSMGLIYHGLMLHCEKYCMDMKINYGQICSAIVQRHIVIYKGNSTMVNHVYFRAYIPWLYSINLSGL